MLQFGEIPLDFSPFQLGFFSQRMKIDHKPSPASCFRHEHVYKYITSLHPRNHTTKTTTLSPNTQNKPVACFVREFIHFNIKAPKQVPTIAPSLHSGPSVGKHYCKSNASKAISIPLGWPKPRLGTLFSSYMSIFKMPWEHFFSFCKDVHLEDKFKMIGDGQSSSSHGPHSTGACP